MLDIFSISSTAFKRVRNCSLSPGIPSDHGAVGINLSRSSIKHIGERKVTRGVINWEKIRNDSITRATFNARLEMLNQESSLTYSSYFENVLRAGADTAMHIIDKEKGWFEDKRDTLLPAIETKNVLLNQMRAAAGAANDAYITLKEELKRATELVSNKVAIAKANWHRKQANLVHQMCTHPAQAWKASQHIIARDSCHHNKPVTMKMKMEDGSLATNDKQNAEVFTKHLQGVYNATRPRFALAAETIRQREELKEIGEAITWKEFNDAIRKLKCGKAPGITAVAPDALKCLDGPNKQQIFQYITDFWEDDADYWEWHTGIGVLVPKKGDLSDPNKWRGINLN